MNKVEHLKSFILSETDAKKRIRLIGVSHFLDGNNRSQILRRENRGEQGVSFR